jgi:uncharacterized protein
MICTQCGTCCVAPDIKLFKKPMGVPCEFLDQQNRCMIYESRPDFCRGYVPDELCELVAAPTREQRVQKYLQIFGFL